MNTDTGSPTRSFWRMRLRHGDAESPTRSAIAWTVMRRSCCSARSIRRSISLHESTTSDRPTVFIAYTVKGRGPPPAGNKDNHAGQMTEAQIGSLRVSSGGSVYLQLSTRPFEQIPRAAAPKLSDDMLQGGYWLEAPEPSCDVAVHDVTSADRLNAGWHAAQRARRAGDVEASATLSASCRQCRTALHW